MYISISAIFAVIVKTILRHCKINNAADAENRRAIFRKRGASRPEACRDWSLESSQGAPGTVSGDDER
jgi:hypothetical protein